MDKGNSLTLEDFEKAAIFLGCERAAIQAVAQVEAPGSGFFPNGEPKTLFEGHKFFKFTAGRFAESHPSICYPTWTKKWYGKTWEQEYRRFVIAYELYPIAAILSASFGRFQIMGFNYYHCGFDDAYDFYRTMKLDEQRQLDAFVQFLNSLNLATALATCDWRKFARGYNGPRYEENNYHVKLEEAYNIFKNH